MLELVRFVPDLEAEFLYFDGVLLVRAGLPAARVLEIIARYLEPPYRGGDE